MNGHVQHRSVPHHIMTIKTLHCGCWYWLSVHVMWFCPSFMWQVCTGLHYHYVNSAEFLKLGWHRTHFVRHFISLSWHQLAFYTVAQQIHQLHGVNNAQQLHQTVHDRYISEVRLTMRRRYVMLYGDNSAQQIHSVTWPLDRVNNA